MDYKQSGVDIDAGNETVRRIRDLAKSTFTPGVLSEIGTFGGLFRLDTSRYREPVLVSSADGVGTKLKVAFMARVHHTVGTDLVNHCVNDILVQGAEPLFFLDYLATGRLAPEVAAEIIKGMAVACKVNGCALLGGETAEMPGFYSDEEYDLAGFIVGVVDRPRLVDGSGLRTGDTLIGLPSSGLHTNGYSLARRIVFDHLGLSVQTMVPELGCSIGDALLVPHRSYLLPCGRSWTRGLVKGMAHITGGGITDNLPRMLPDGLIARSIGGPGRCRPSSDSFSSVDTCPMKICGARSTWGLGSSWHARASGLQRCSIFYDPRGSCPWRWVIWRREIDASPISEHLRTLAPCPHDLKILE